MKTENKLQPILLVSSSYGIYTPQTFSEWFPSYLTDEQKADLSNPDNEFYWETWKDVLDNTIIKDDLGNEFYLMESEDCDLWAIPSGTDWEDFI